MYPKRGSALAPNIHETTAGGRFTACQGGAHAPACRGGSPRKPGYRCCLAWHIRGACTACAAECRRRHTSPPHFGDFYRPRHPRHGFQASPPSPNRPLSARVHGASAGALQTVRAPQRHDLVGWLMDALKVASPGWPRWRVEPAPPAQGRRPRPAGLAARAWTLKALGPECPRPRWPQASPHETTGPASRPYRPASASGPRCPIPAAVTKPPLGERGADAPDRSTGRVSVQAGLVGRRQGC